jgi:dolichyl-phosphate beta-glucosyltransferase
MQKNRPSLSIVIGALREEKRIGKTLDALAVYLKDEGLFDSEVIVVAADGGDKTIDIVESKSKYFSNLRVIKPGKPVGKGRDIKLGMQSAKGELRLFMDADLATPLKYIKLFVQEWQANEPDVIIGVRELSIIHHSWFRHFVSWLGNLGFFVASGTYISDTQCGFKAFTKKAVDICFSRMTRMHWSFDMELLSIAHQNKLKIEKIKVEGWKDVPGGTFEVNLKHYFIFANDMFYLLFSRLSGRFKR